ncbi:RNA polymerase sigma factor [Nocardioides sp.]|uniref:RNA polymerase sigma factor n=1 Tax=Nocardioides sp. TaxID=35761 RepID=UPI003784B469
MLRIAYVLAGNLHDAEDLVQVTLLQTARHWHKARTSPHGYARTVLVNASKDRWRHRGRRPAETRLDGDESLAHAGAPDGAIEQLLERDLVIRALRSLPPRQRAVVALRYLEDLSVEDTADALGCSTGTVKTQASRALQRLRSELGPLMGQVPSNTPAQPPHRDGPPWTSTTKS